MFKLFFVRVVAVSCSVFLWSTVLVYGQEIERTATGVEVNIEANASVDLEDDAGSEQGDEPPKTAEELAAEAERNARLQELARELDVRRRAIEDLQSEQGIYYPGLVEAHSDIARLQIEMEDFDGAVQSLNDALQIARINSGLYSEQQLPLIDELIDQNLKREDWQEVDDLVHLDHHISSRVYENADSEYLAAADDYGKWKLRVLQENLLSLNSQGLINTAEDLSDFYGRIIVNVEFAEELDANDLLRLLEGKSRADLSLARSVASTPYSYFQGTASRYVTQQRCSNQRAPNGQLVRQCYNVQVENPRYRQSQRDAKRFALNRHSQEISKIIERMELIRMSDNGLSTAQRQQLDLQIGQLRAEAEAVRRLGFRGYRF